MFTSAKTVLAVIALSLALSFLGTRNVRADDVAKAAPLPQIGFIAAKSIDSVTSFVKKTGMDLPAEISTDGLEKQFPFLGPGSLDTTRPIGIAVCGGADISSGQSMAFIFPVKPTGGTLDSLKKMGGTPMPDHPDTVLMGAVGIRRTADYLIFSPTADVVSNVNLDAFTASVKSDDALVRLVVDFKTFRTTLPDRYKAMTDAFQTSALSGAGGSKTDQENSLMFVKPIINLMETVDRVEVGLDSGEKGIRLAITATPLKVATAAAANRPGMPPGVFARVDTNFAPSDSTTSVRNQIQKAFNGGFIGNGPVSDEKRKEMEAIGNKLGALVSDAATTSLGVEIIDKAPVLYIVQHWSKAIDAPKEWKHLIEEGNAAAGDKKEEIGTETYTEGALSVVRLTLKKDKPVYLDIAQRDNDVFITISPADAHHIASLMAVEPQGPMKGILSGSVDLGKTIEAAAKMPDSPLAGMPADVQKQLVDLLAGQQISITTSADGDAGTLEITVTKGMLESIPKLMGILNGK